MDNITYMAARNAAIQQVDIAFYGENFPERLRNLWARLKSEPEIVADEVNEWLGSWHPEAMRISHEAMLLVRKKPCLEKKCFVDVYEGVPVSGQISTEQEYLEALEDTDDFCGRWREFKSREEAQSFIDNPNGMDEDDGRIEITPGMFPIAFQSWQNGGIQTSSIYFSNRFYDNGESEYDAFVSKHEDSNTFATLHICNNLEEWIATDIELFGEVVDESIINTIYGSVVNSVLEGWSFDKSDIYDTPITITFSDFEECDDEDNPDIKGWNVYTSDYGEIYIVSE